MISAKMVPEKGDIAIKFSEPQRDVLIKAFTAYLHALRAAESKELSPELETLESLRFTVRTAQNQSANRYAASLTFVEAYFLIQTLRYIVHSSLVTKPLPEEYKQVLVLFIARISKLIFEAMDSAKCNDLKDITPRSVSYLYIQYIDYLLEKYCGTQEEKQEALFELLRHQKNEMNASHDPSNNKSLIPALPYPQFQSRCKAWMEKHGMEDICLEEVVEDELFQ